MTIFQMRSKNSSNSSSSWLRNLRQAFDGANPLEAEDGTVGTENRLGTRIEYSEACEFDFALRLRGASSGLGGLPVHQKLRDRARFHVAHGLELTGFLAVQQLASRP